MSKIADLAKILRTLGNEDAIKILRFARGGFEGRSDAYKSIGLSIKRYYSRLKTLIDVGLVVKNGSRYELTPLGKIVHNSLEGRVLWAISNLEQLQVLETLRKSKTIDGETMRRISATILDVNLNEIPVGGGEIIADYEELVDTTVQLVDESVEKLYLASRYTDGRVVEAILRALRRGVEMWFLDGDVGIFAARMKMLRMVLAHPSLVKAFYELWHSPNVQIRRRALPFSFMIVDDRASCIELVNPTTNDFFAAILTRNNERLIEKLTKSFGELWREGGPDPLKEFSEKLMEGDKH